MNAQSNFLCKRHSTTPNMMNNWACLIFGHGIFYFLDLPHFLLAQYYQSWIFPPKYSREVKGKKRLFKNTNHVQSKETTWINFPWIWFFLLKYFYLKCFDRKSCLFSPLNKSLVPPKWIRKSLNLKNEQYWCLLSLWFWCIHVNCVGDVHIQDLQRKTIFIF